MGEEREGMICRSCGNEERASEGYPCEGCGAFICVICSLRGVTLCKDCAAKSGVTSSNSVEGST